MPTTLPQLTPIENLDIRDPLDLLSPEERARMRRELEEMAKQRRQAEADSSSLRLG
jgi:hypothetical protein